MKDESEIKRSSGGTGGLPASVSDGIAQSAKRSFEDLRSQAELGNEDYAVYENKSFVTRVLSYALRGGIAGLILGVGIWTLQGIAALFHSDPEVVQSPADEPPPLESLAAAELMAGAWNFMDEGWSISAELLAEEDARQAFSASTVSIPPVLHSATNHHGDELLAVIKQRATRTRDGKLWRYAVSQGGCEMQVYATDTKPEIFQHAALLVPYGDSQTWLMRFHPDAGESAPAKSELSPLPASVPSRLLCQRKNSAGEVFCQLLRVQATYAELLRALHRDRWEIDEPSGKVGSGFVTIHVHRAAESFWMVASSFEDDPSLRVLIVHDLPNPITSNKN